MEERQLKIIINKGIIFFHDDVLSAGEKLGVELYGRNI